MAALDDESLAAFWWRIDLLLNSFAVLIEEHEAEADGHTIVGQG